MVVVVVGVSCDAQVYPEHLHGSTFINAGVPARLASAFFSISVTDARRRLASRRGSLLPTLGAGGREERSGAAFISEDDCIPAFSQLASRRKDRTEPRSQRKGELAFFNGHLQLQDQRVGGQKKSRKRRFLSAP